MRYARTPKGRCGKIVNDEAFLLRFDDDDFDDEDSDDEDSDDEDSDDEE